MTNDELADRIEARAGYWQVMALCDCGEAFEAWRGDLFFVSEQCCPSCGADKRDFDIKTVRWVRPIRGPWWKLWPVIEPGFWQHGDKPA